MGRSEDKSLKVSWEWAMSRCKHDFWVLPRCWRSLDLWKDEVYVPSSVTVVPFILPELSGNGMKFVFEKGASSIVVLDIVLGSLPR
ncbi:hypothetical protein AVEN_72212-1 [Araneus ventricosus]|uniref:Uncharacterized protein n=1 Tax=Araneus ventricosus TaxID=182803 RepID=A0A4Y2HET5_ARAVE|nr:hypothetical protein AVEN_72212-1 [Araneus ventricosus]